MSKIWGFLSAEWPTSAPQKSNRLTTILLVASFAFAASVAAPAQATFSVLFTFDGADGQNPQAPLIQGTDGNFYGTSTSLGANSEGGAVFKVTPQGKPTALYSFCSKTNCADGAFPAAGLVQGVDGNFYGTTVFGGTGSDCPTGDGYPGCGTVFQLTPEGKLTTLYNFCSQPNCTDGANPYGGLVQGSDKNFYGTTTEGGFISGSCVNNFGDQSGCGTVFKISSDGNFTSLWTFCQQNNCPDGSAPTGTLIEAANGNFYGTTGGTVFQITSGGELTTIYSFCSLDNCADGLQPYAGVIQGTDGNFYGTTLGGGVNVSCPSASTGCGTVFRLTPAGALTTLYAFCTQTNSSGFCLDGENPYGGVVQAYGNLYGTTSLGGNSTNNPPGGGTIFELSPQGKLTTLHEFCAQSGCPDGFWPYASLLLASNGNFYGTTYFSAGTVFSLGVQSGAPAVTLSPTSLNFGNQNVNTTSAAKTVTLTNSGNATLNLSGVAASAGFAISKNTCGSSLGAGKTCKVSVTFTPTQPGSITGNLSFTDNAPGSPQAVTLSGIGLAPAVTLSPISLKFGNQTVNTTSPPQTVTLTNSGTATLTISGITASASFAISTNTCGSTLNAGSACSVSVTFTPTATGPVTGNLTFSDNAAGSPQSVSLSGTGVASGAPGVKLSPTSLNFGNVAVKETSAAKSVTLTNSGTATLDITEITASAGFAISTKTCGSALAAGKSCKISVTFTPKALGAASGTLTFTDNASSSPQTVALSGTGVAPVTLTPASAAYAKQKVGTTSAPKTFTLTNNQNVALTGIAISTTGNFAVSATTCATTLAANAKCTISVTFTPTKTGTLTGKLQAKDTAPASPQTSSLTGTGD
jgi:uncharacterized repeat protein (TIGR03803 family)